MRKRIKRGIALLLSVIMVGTVTPLPTITTRAEESTNVGDSTGMEVASDDALGVQKMDEESTPLESYVEEYFDLGEVETSAIPMEVFGLSDGKVSLISGTAINWIDRLDLTGDAQVIKNLYNTLVEASDNDGVDDYLIEDSYFVLSTENNNVSSIKVAEITGTLDGTYSEADAKTKVSEVASEILANYSPYIRAAYDAFDRDHSEVFWLDGRTQAVCSSPYTIKETEQEGLYTVDYTVTIQFVLKSSEFDIRATNYKSQSSIEEAITTVNNKVSTLVNAVSGKTDVEKIAYFNEQLTKTNEYNTSSDLNNIGHDCRECTSALTGSTGENGPVCEAYARAFKVLCDEAGIPCVLVDGQAKNSANSEGEAHMWNYVQVDNEWRAVDVTWNDPKVSGVSGAISGSEGTKWLLVYADSVISDGMTFIESHPVANQASQGGVAFTNGPELAVAPDVINTREVATEAEFNAALEDESVHVIQLKQAIDLSRSSDGKDNAVVISRPVTITGQILRLERAGIVLGADVTFENITLCFNTSVRNAIIANGYSLTINNVSSDGTFAIDLFCGGITDYTGGNADEIPETGSNGSITMKGKNTIGTNIYAGSLSDVVDGVTDIPNTYNGSATIILEKDATGFSNIYAHGARENRSGGYPNEWLPSAELYEVSGDVTIQLNSNKVVTIDGATGGATGGTKNAAFIYKDDGNGYVCQPTLNNVDSIALLPSDSGTMAHLAPNTTQTSFTTLSVPKNTRLSFVYMGDEILVSSFAGGGEIVLKEPSETSQKLTLSTATDTTKIAVGGLILMVQVVLEQLVQTGLVLRLLMLHQNVNFL